MDVKQTLVSILQAPHRIVSPLIFNTLVSSVYFPWLKIDGLFQVVIFGVVQIIIYLYFETIRRFFKRLYSPDYYRKYPTSIHKVITRNTRSDSHFDPVYSDKAYSRRLNFEVDFWTFIIASVLFPFIIGWVSFTLLMFSKTKLLPVLDFLPVFELRKLTMVIMFFLAYLVTVWGIDATLFDLSRFRKVSISVIVFTVLLAGFLSIVGFSYL